MTMKIRGTCPDGRATRVRVCKQIRQHRYEFRNLSSRKSLTLKRDAQPCSLLLALVKFADHTRFKKM